MTMPVLCSTIAREANSQLFGTATRVDVWLMLEYTGPWGKLAFEQSDLPEPVKATLDKALIAIPESRLQLMKRDPPYELPRITFAVAVPSEIDPALYVFELQSYDELLALEIPAIARRDPTYDAHRSDERMILICTNAKRDTCCAVRGLAAYGQAVEAVGSQVWRTTHLGGHRYAATGVILPDGVMVGRLDDVEPGMVAAEAVAGRIVLPALRGRSAYPPPAQAAEYYLRADNGIMEINAYRLSAMSEIGPDQWEVCFSETGPEPVTHVLGITRLISDTEIPKSCTSADTERIEDYRLLYYQITS